MSPPPAMNVALPSAARKKNRKVKTKMNVICSQFCLAAESTIPYHSQEETAETALHYELTSREGKFWESFLVTLKVIFSSLGKQEQGMILGGSF